MQDPNDYPDQVYLVRLYRRIHGTVEDMPALLVQEEIPPGRDPQGIRYIQYREYERLQREIQRLKKELEQVWTNARQGKLMPVVRD